MQPSLFPFHSPVSSSSREMNSRARTWNGPARRRYDIIYTIRVHNLLFSSLLFFLSPVIFVHGLQKANERRKREDLGEIERERMFFYYFLCASRLSRGKAAASGRAPTGMLGIFGLTLIPLPSFLRDCLATDKYCPSAHSRIYLLLRRCHRPSLEKPNCARGWIARLRCTLF